MTAPVAFKDHFSGRGGGYAAHRPTYPAALVDFLAGLTPDHGAVWDCGCGTGQLSPLLAARFDRVVATDASADQIAHATPAPRVAYRCAPAERSGLPDRSVDLVTVAQAAHWFDLPAFYGEVRRVARPGAAVALVTYGILHVGDAAADAEFGRFYREVAGPHWPPERRHVEDGYASLPFPFAPLPAGLAAPPLAIEAVWTLADLTGYVDTWSATAALAKAEGDGPVTAFRERMAAAWPSGPDTRLPVRWPLAVRAGRV